jgi:hypothetical protein
MPSKNPSIALGVVAYVVLSLGAAFLILQGGTALGALAGCLGCLVILAGPMLAVWHYTSTHRVTLLPGQGAGLGAITGAAGALVAGLIQQALIALDVLPDTAESLAMQREEMLSQGMDPAQIDSAMSFAESLGGLTSNPFMGLVLGVVLGAALGALFGALAAVMFKKGGPASDAAV